MQRLQPGMALLPLRLFLGITFVYAGVQKLSDPGYLHPGAPTYIGTQLHGFAHGTPGGFLLRTFALPQPKLAGVAVALLEIAIGLLVTAGLFTRVAAAVGLGLNLVLFLTNSWGAYPYFLGSDIVFVFAWLPFVLAGAAGQPALDNALDRLARSPRMRMTPAPGQPALSRREVLGRSLGLAGAATLGIGGVAALAKGSYKPAQRTLSAAPAKPSPKPAAPAAARQALPQGAVRLGPANRVPVGQAATYRDPADGSPDIAIHMA
ncbi:MAG: thiosulfate dehydrogenase (quinone) large subunit, partial [Solirubrobacteraceae bacterium]|nr:thiosulfate dehydrogenase (quinone) large subunit [Solirubrobacteraceae bacterium]